MRALLAAALTLAATSQAAGGIDGVGGGELRSPDGTWTVHASAVDPDGETTPAVAWLHGPTVARRRLMQFERHLDAVWPSGTNQVLLVERTLHFASIRAFTLGPREEGPTDRIQQDIERGLAAHSPQLGTVENRQIAFGSDGARLCVLAEESGLPPGHRLGSFLVRRQAFRIDPAARRAVPTELCPGARLDS